MRAYALSLNSARSDADGAGAGAERISSFFTRTEATSPPLERAVLASGSSGWDWRWVGEGLDS